MLRCIQLEVKKGYQSLVNSCIRFVFETSRSTQMNISTGIVNMTRTPLGSALMRQWLIRPSLELEVIEQRHETVACLLRTENGTSTFASSLTVTLRNSHTTVTALASAVEAIRKELKMVKNANKALATLLHGRGSLREWLILWQVSHVSITHAVGSYAHSASPDALRFYSRVRCNPRSHSFSQS